MALYARPRRPDRRRRITALLVAVVAFAATASLVSGRLPLSTAATERPQPVATTPAPVAVEPGTGGAVATDPPGASPPVDLPPAKPDPTPVGELPPTPEPPSAPSVVPEAALQARLDALRAKLAIPGVSAAIIFPDGTMWTGVSGVADLRSGAPVEPDTAFAIASISKTYTSALVMSLVEDGLVELDAPASTYLPDLPLLGAVTVRQMLDHTSGLNDYFMHPKIDARLTADRTRAWTTEEVLAHVRKPVFAPGRGWDYSNTNYVLLAEIAEAVDGRSLGEQLRERFLDPLELDRTWEQVDEKARADLAHGYSVRGTTAKPAYTDVTRGSKLRPFTALATAAHGTGSLAATSGDVARWARALYGGRVLAKGTLGLMVADARATARLRPDIPYGLGVQLVELDGRAALGHSGRLAGFRSVVRHLPGEGITIAVLTNQSTQDPARIARALVRIAIGAQPPG